MEREKRTLKRILKEESPIIEKGKKGSRAAIHTIQTSTGTYSYPEGTEDTLIRRAASIGRKKRPYSEQRILLGQQILMELGGNKELIIKALDSDADDKLKKFCTLYAKKKMLGSYRIEGLMKKFEYAWSVMPIAWKQNK